MAFRVGDGYVYFPGNGLAAADVVVGGKAGVIGVVGQFGEGLLFDLQKKMGGGHFLLGNVGPEADGGKKQDGGAVNFF